MSSAKWRPFVSASMYYPRQRTGQSHEYNSTNATPLYWRAEINFPGAARYYAISSAIFNNAVLNSHRIEIIPEEFKGMNEI